MGDRGRQICQTLAMLSLAAFFVSRQFGLLPAIGQGILVGFALAGFVAALTGKKSKNQAR